MKKIARCLMPVVGLTWLSLHFGCQGPTLVTTAPPPSSGPVNGMLYYLPIGKITIKGEFKPASSGEKKEERAASTGKPGDGGGGSSTAGPVAVTAAELTITLTPEVEADETAGEYYVTPQTNDIFEDEVRVTANSKQLLSAGKVTTEDKTAEIVGTIASIAAQAAEKEVATATPTQTPLPPPFYFSFHPSCYKEYQDVKGELEIRGIALKMSPEPRPRDKEIRPNAVQTGELAARGLLFRPATSYKITLCYDGTDLWNGTKATLIKTTQQFILPDPNRLYEIQYLRMAFVKKVKDIGFRDGMLTEFYQKRPSPILGFLGIPKAIVQAIVPIPAAPPSGSGSASGTTGGH